MAQARGMASGLTVCTCNSGETLRPMYTFWLYNLYGSSPEQTCSTAAIACILAVKAAGELSVVVCSFVCLLQT